MRYDLEVNIVGQLTQDGLNLLANMFYDNSKDLITPVRWDSMALSDEPNATKSDLNTSKFNRFKNVKDTAFVSGVYSQDDISIFKLLIRENIVTPIFNGGDLLFYRYKYRWSNNNIVKLSDWDEIQQVYTCEVDDDIDETSIQVFTLKLASPGYLGYYREFSYVDISNIIVKKINKADLPAQSQKNVIYCCIDTREIFEVDDASYHTYKTFDITYLQDGIPALPGLNDRWVTVGRDTDIIYFFDGYRYINIAANRALRLSQDDYKFTVYTDPLQSNKKFVITNCKSIFYNNVRLGSSPQAKRVMIGLPEFPIKNILINDLDTDSSKTSYYGLMNSAILVTNRTPYDADVTGTFQVYPLVTYRQTSRENKQDIVYSNINIIPSGIGFKNGLVCVYNTFSPTIPTKYGSHLPLPIQLSMSLDKNEISALEGVKVTAMLSGIDGIPIKGAKIKFTIYQDELDRQAQWMGSGNSTFESFTGVDGTTNAIILQTNSKYGFFIQKEWVHDNIIDVPFHIGVMNKNRVYLYIVTADDPILGKLSAESNIGETPLSEYYQRHDRLDSYTVNGRRIAYVKMKTMHLPTTRILQSAYIKPTSLMAFTDKRMYIRDLYIQQFKDDNITILNPTGASGFVVPNDTSSYIQFSVPDGSLANVKDVTGWSPECQQVHGKLKLQEVLVKSGVTLIYPDTIPGTTGTPQDDRIIGYWLVTGSGGRVDVGCQFENDTMALSADPVPININNFIRSEREFIISESTISDQNSILGSFGYYTISEFIKNPFNMSANTYCCSYSDPVMHKCLNKSNIDVIDSATGLTITKKVSSFYSLDSVNSTTCIHSPTYDATLPEDQRCPGLDAHYVNPFILHVQK